MMRHQTEHILEMAVNIGLVLLAGYFILTCARRNTFPEPIPARQDGCFPKDGCYPEVTPPEAP